VQEDEVLNVDEGVVDAVRPHDLQRVASFVGTAQVPGKIQRRVDIEGNLSIRESVRRPHDELNRTSDLRLAGGSCIRFNQH
jgi:hypothetical protein